MISPRSVEIQPSEETSTKLGMKVTAAGTMRVSTVSPRTSRLSRWSIRASP